MLRGYLLVDGGARGTDSIRHVGIFYLAEIGQGIFGYFILNTSIYIAVIAK